MSFSPFLAPLPLYFLLDLLTCCFSNVFFFFFATGSLIPMILRAFCKPSLRPSPYSTFRIRVWHHSLQQVLWYDQPRLLKEPFRIQAKLNWDSPTRTDRPPSSTPWLYFHFHLVHLQCFWEASHCSGVARRLHAVTRGVLCHTHD